MMLSTSARPIDASARIIRVRKSSKSHGPYYGVDLLAVSSITPRSPNTFAAIVRASHPSAIMSVVDGSAAMLFSNALTVSSDANGNTCTMYPPALRISRALSRLTPTAIADVTCSLSSMYVATSSAISPVTMFTMPVNGCFQSGCARETLRMPLRVVPRAEL